MEIFSSFSLKIRFSNTAPGWPYGKSSPVSTSEKQKTVYYVEEFQVEIISLNRFDSKLLI